MIITRGYHEQQQIVTRGLGVYESVVIEEPYIPYIPMIPVRFPFRTEGAAAVPEGIEPEDVEAWLKLLRDNDEILILLN